MGTCLGTRARVSARYGSGNSSGSGSTGWYGWGNGRIGGELGASRCLGFSEGEEY
jgi:hypothetical protein